MTMPEPAKRTVGIWQQPFRAERDVSEQFARRVDDLLLVVQDDELLASAGELCAPLETGVRGLIFAREKYNEWAANSGRTTTSMFLAPAVRTATSIAETLMEAGRYVDAFSTANVFGEMCKVILERNLNEYPALFERLLLVGCRAVSGAWQTDVGEKQGDDPSDEIDQLRRRMANFLRYALGTYVHKSGSYLRAGKPDVERGERVMNEALALHFDARLRHLLQFARPRVNDYIRASLPRVYEMKLSDRWRGKDGKGGKFEEWNRLLVEAGFEDSLRDLETMGVVPTDQVGKIPAERLDEVRRAEARNERERVYELLKGHAEELRFYLERQRRNRLVYREPRFPKLPEKLWQTFKKAKSLAETNDPAHMVKALQLVEFVWENEFFNLEVKDWVAYLKAKTENLHDAEQLLEEIRNRREAEHNYVTDWNLAVLRSEREDEEAAYELLLPLLDGGTEDRDLLFVVLALALKRGDHERFLAIMPRTTSLQFHPLAFVVAHQTNNRARADELLAQLLTSRAPWELPPVSQRFRNFDDMELQVLRKALVARQYEQVVNWLEQRIRRDPGWVENYWGLAFVYENGPQDIDTAFQVLRRHYDLELKHQPRNQQFVDGACRELLNLCRRSGRRDLGRQAHQLAVAARASDDLIRSYQDFAPPPVLPVSPKPDDPRRPEPRGPKPKSEPPPEKPLRDSSLVERLAKVSPRLMRIRDISSYVQEINIIDEYVKVVAELYPHDSGRVVELIKGASNAIQGFAQTSADKQDDRRTLYDKAAAFEKKIGSMLEGVALDEDLANLIASYHEILKRVVGDLSRLAGVSPSIKVTLENTFLSLEASRSTLVLRLTNTCERDVTNVAVGLVIESPLLAVAERSKRTITALGSRRSHLLSIPIERTRDTALRGASEIDLDISLSASAEGYPNFDLGVSRLRVPIKTLEEAIGRDQIPARFPETPLTPTDQELFQGRSDVLNKIKNSFYDGIQQRRYYLDGIRRVGKTSILNFLRTYLPENVIAVPVSFELVGLKGRIQSSVVLRHFCALIGQEVASATGVTLDLPDQAAFDAAPGPAFTAFLGKFRTEVPGRVPFLMFDEFQLLLEAIARTGSGSDQDTLVLDQLRGHLDEKRLNAVFTGSVRFDRLGRIFGDHRILGSLSPLRISFLSEESVGHVLCAGLERWATVPLETIQRLHQLTGGYPWHVQAYGSALVDLLNRERRTVVTPDDVEEITRNTVLPNDKLFEYWWPEGQLGVDEERFIETLLSNYQADQLVSSRAFFSQISTRDEPSFRRAIVRLRACEVLDSTQTEILRFSGDVLRRKLEQHVQEGKLTIPWTRKKDDHRVDPGQAGIFVDHENLVRSLIARICPARGKAVPQDRLPWFSDILNHLLQEAERRVGTLTHKVTVAFWHRPSESQFLPAYFALGFEPKQPVEVKENAADFKLADEIRVAGMRAMQRRDPAGSGYPHHRRWRPGACG